MRSDPASHSAASQAACQPTFVHRVCSCFVRTVRTPCWLGVCGSSLPEVVFSALTHGLM